MGRPRDKVWKRVTQLKGERWKCNDCGGEFAGGASRIKAHLNITSDKVIKDKGIGLCTGKANSNNDTEHNLLHSQEAGQIQGDDAKCEERIQVGSSFVSNGENEDLQMMKRYVFECLRPEDKVFISPLSYLTQEGFITLEPEAHLDSLVVDIFVEILTDIERKKKPVPSNCYLPVTFSDAAVKGKVGHFLNFVHSQKVKENYMSDLESCEKIFIPVHVGARPDGGHFYLYIIHLKNKEIEIWDSLPNAYVAERIETAKKLLLAMEKLFEEVPFPEFHLKRADDILLQPPNNGFDCGVFVINYMQQSDNYVKRDSSFQFDSQKERKDLALKLLNNDLNREKQNLYYKARRHYAQVEKQDGNKRLRVATSTQYFEKGQIQGDAKYQERIQVGSSSFVSNWENEELRMIDCLRPEEYVFQSPRLHLTKSQFITLQPETWLDSGVIDMFVEILTESEKKKATPSNCYLTVMFSKAALESVEHNFKCFVQRQNIRENDLFHIKSPPEKVFIPVHIEQEKQGHFYLYIFHLNKKVVEIWDSLPTFVAETDRDETTKKLFFAMDILFNLEKGAFSDYQKKMANDILPQGNGFDCGVFVINYMQQSDNYVKINPLFQFDSKKEREDLALKLLKNDLNQNLYDKLRWHYAQAEKKDGNDPSKVPCEDDGKEPKGSSRSCILPTTYLLGEEFQRYTEQIWKWIKDDKVSAIGVWGRGGSGKTALASHICGKLLEEVDIKVIWVTVSQNYCISHLQKIIARSIELDISDEFEVKIIAEKLFQAFKDMKKCVIILDDVWDIFFLKEVGFRMFDNRIKLVLTTRIWEVCQGMSCEKCTIQVQPLEEEYSWELFKKIIGFHDDLSLEVRKIAKNIARECEGLPLAIVRIATSMKGKKQVGEWSHMLECLKNLGHGQYEMDKWVFPVLRSSYDFLNNKLQRFFLYCALSTKGGFDDDSDYDLIKRFVHENIDETKKLRVQYDEGYSMLDRLNNHGMLEQSDELFETNKFLRALAIDIAEDTGKIMAKAYKNLAEIPSDAQWRDGLQKAFLMGNDIETIPDGTRLMCSQLSTLLLNDNEDLNYISDDFFSNMPALETLNLSKTRIKRLPESVSSLKCLTALLLSGCEALSYIPSLSKLKRLMSLDLSMTAITEAPMGLDSLVNLRRLNLLDTYILMSSSIISKLINLEHLLGPEVTEINIQGLDNLEVIVAFFQDISVFNTYVSFLDKKCELRSFHLYFGESVIYDWTELEAWKIYHSWYFNTITLQGVDLGNRKAVLPGDIKKLFIDNCQLVGTVCGFLCNVDDCHNITPRQIELLHIRWCKDVEYLCCFSGSCPFCSSSQLVGRLCLSHLDDLKDILSPSALLLSHQPDLFSHLTDLSIEACNSMETLMTPKLLALLQNLRTIYISSCYKMKEIVGEDHSQTANGDLMALVPNHLSDPTPITLPKLKSLILYDMPQLNFLYRGIMLCPSLQTFSAYKCEQLNLPRIEISKGCDQLPMEKTSIGYSWQIKTD